MSSCPYLFYIPKRQKIFIKYLKDIDITIKEFRRKPVKNKYNSLGKLSEVELEMNKFWIEYEDALDNYRFMIPGLSSDEEDEDYDLD